VLGPCASHKDREADEGEPIERLMRLDDARRVLGLSWPLMRMLVREGELPAYNTSGTPVRRHEIDQHTRGLKVKPSDLRSYIESIRVK
jgi:hypothetical protein